WIALPTMTSANSTTSTHIPISHRLSRSRGSRSVASASSSKNAAYLMIDPPFVGSRDVVPGEVC
ncbi:MAG: hypothetical protein L0K86_26525, partial [Actinomycetia bacterium]|nr:hypothetical protein [Actinomycetes bacterium]